ncbi:hypothetical protein CVS27_19845 [Arthrobacter glacialis]|uniref:Uncharacterized protein n=1 Tax=Arthrobacter glacialis TaxID=1664 RepID=A0A2S3ZRB1_ARTGL|nr:hypothetical protein CVS27_19845 [Arthrobacter glacialis]
MYAIRSALDQIVGADELIDAAVRALVEGADSPSLPILAGLLRREEDQAQELFRAVTNELDLAPALPMDLAGMRWQLIHWLCESIVDGRAKPEVAGDSIGDFWDQMGYPESLRPFVAWVSEWNDWDPSWDVERDHYRQLIVVEAKALLNVPWPPTQVNRTDL